MRPLFNSKGMNVRKNANVQRLAEELQRREQQIDQLKGAGDEAKRLKKQIQPCKSPSIVEVSFNGQFGNCCTAKLVN
jgi:hypothetical protein